MEKLLVYQMSLNKFKWLLTFLITSVLIINCGGGGGGGSLANNGGGIGGTGITSTGTIDGFGSVFVNGVEFETDSASIVLDSNASSEADLRLGMVVTIVGTVDSNGTTGTALSVEFDDDVQGPITDITASLDGSEKTLTILGFSVIVDEYSTIFDDVTYDTLSINDAIEVSGFIESPLTIRATRIERKELFEEGSSEVEIKGLVSALSGSTFELGSYIVDFSAADLSDVPGGNLSNDLFVEVKGTLSANTITATQIEQEDGLYSNSEENISLEGVISDYINNSDFMVNGQQVDATNAEFEGVTLELEEGIRIEVQGSIVDGVLEAKEVEIRSGSVRLSSSIKSINVDGVTGTITLGYVVGDIVVSINSQTELDDETDAFSDVKWSDLRSGDFIRVKGLINGSQLIASEVRLDDMASDVIQGPVDSFVVDNEITVLGLSYSLGNTVFIGDDHQNIDSAEFFSQLNEGDLVRVLDSVTADGIADEVRLND
jgi:hypothetical protein